MFTKKSSLCDELTDTIDVKVVGLTGGRGFEGLHFVTDSIRNENNHSQRSLKMLKGFQKVPSIAHLM